MLYAAIVIAGLGQPADLVIENARIWSDGIVGFTEFAAVRDGRFVHVGARSDTLIGPRTERLDAGGRVVVPGLIDSHIHMLSGGRLLTQLQLREARGKDDFVKRIAEWSAKLPADRWVLGGRWSVETWQDPQPPTKEWIDAAGGDHPVFLPRMDGHSALVNSLALRIAGITRDGPPDPAGGVIDRDPKTREPTGILRESAMNLVARHMPPPTVDDRVEALRRAMIEANQHGITAVSDIPSIEDLPAYERLAASELTVRFFLYPTTSDWAAAMPVLRGFSGKADWVSIRGLKTYVDGSLGSRTAYMHDAYLGNPDDKPGWRGLLRESAEGNRLRDNVNACRDSPFQPIAHAIGDEANHVLLDAYANALAQTVKGRRCRVEHAQHLLADDIQRIARLGVIASMQPFHKADDGRYAATYIGPDRSRLSYAFKSLLDAGAVVAFGSDWPVVTLNPFPGIEAAVTGRTLDGKTWQPQENISVAEALRCYTSRGAYAAFAEADFGRVTPGCFADFVVLESSPFDAKPAWSAIRPSVVYVAGRRVWPRP